MTLSIRVGIVYGFISILVVIGSYESPCFGAQQTTPDSHPAVIAYHQYRTSFQEVLDSLKDSLDSDRGGILADLNDRSQRLYRLALESGADRNREAMERRSADLTHIISEFKFDLGQFLDSVAAYQKESARLSGRQDKTKKREKEDRLRRLLGILLNVEEEETDPIEDPARRQSELTSVMQRVERVGHLIHAMARQARSLQAHMHTRGNGKLAFRLLLEDTDRHFAEFLQSIWDLYRSEELYAQNYRVHLDHLDTVISTQQSRIPRRHLEDVFRQLELHERVLRTIPHSRSEQAPRLERHVSSTLDTLESVLYERR